MSLMILGGKYNFSKLDISKLKAKFYRIDFIKYKGRNPREMRLEVENLVKSHSYKFIIINTKALVDAKTIKYLTLLQFRLQKKRVKIITIEKFLEKFLQKCYIPDDDSDLKFLGDIKPYNPFEYCFKRTIDYVGGISLYAILFFLKFYVQKKINEQSPGSLYFIQNRVGLNAKTFKCYKFRTMHENSKHNPYTQQGDERVFGFGNFMRKARLDEIPQCINVLRGQMHLIGPRAEWDILVRDYEKKIPYYNERHLVRPGITGWAQVNYPYGVNADDAKQKLMYDLYYIKHWSPWLEINTIFRTFAIMLGKKGI